MSGGAGMKRINWKRVWKEFDTWYVNEEQELANIPPWKDQQNKIQELVEAEVKK